MKRKKVLIVAHRWLPRMGGVQVYSYTISEILEKMGFEVTIVTSRSRNVKNIFPFGTKLVEISASDILYNRFGIPQPIFSFSIFNKIREEVKKSDIVFINDRYYFSSILASYYARKFNKKSILFIHTSIQKYEGVKKILYFLNNQLGKLTLTNAEAIVALSKKVLKEVCEYYKIKPKKEFIINNLSTEVNVGKKKKSSKMKIIFTGRLIEEKGIFDLLSVAKILSREEEYHFYLVGEGKDKAQLQKRIEELNIKNITLIGKIEDRSKMIKFISSCDLLVLLAKKAEGFSLSTAEALLLGKPIIISQNVPFNEAVKKKAGFVFKPEDHEEIAKAIKFIHKNSSIYQSMSVNAYNFAKANLDRKKNMSNLKRLLANV